MVLALVLVALGPGLVQGAAYESNYITSITYQNIGTATTSSLTILFYETPSDTTPIPITCGPTVPPAPCKTLAAGAGTSVYVGGISGFPAGFQGTAVMSSDQPLAATLVQIPEATTVKARPLSNGFSAGTPQSLIATVVKGTVVSKFAVQNAGTSNTTITVKFYAVGSSTPAHTMTQALVPGAGQYYDLSTIGALGTTFSGSVVVDTAGGTGSIVASSMELETGAGVGAKAFEGVGQGATTFYMPSASCKSNGAGASTYYAIQNAGAANTNITVTYRPVGGGTSYTQTFNGLTPGGKTSLGTCSVAGIPKGSCAVGDPCFNGSAVITSSGGVPIIAIGKVNGGGVATAFVGFSTGYTKLALPYVRYADNAGFTTGKQRTYIAIQNVGAAIAAGTPILVKYINTDGTVAGTHTYTGGLGQYEKFSSNASLAGLTTFGMGTGGGAIVEGPAGSLLATIARSQTSYAGGLPGEDYNGIPVP